MIKMILMNQKQKINTICGIDYSMSCPSVCVHTGAQWSFLNCVFYFLTTRKKFLIVSDLFIGELHRDYLTQQERFNNISEWVLNKIPKNSFVFLEDYSFGSKGLQFSIGENTGLLKHKLWKEKRNLNCFSPSAIKKYATTKGNANKDLMHKAFYDETGVKIDQIFDIKPGTSPIADIIDSYFIAKFGFDFLRKTHTK